MTDLFGVAGTVLLETVELAPAYRYRVQSLRRLIKASEVPVGSGHR